ncbi:hypothetical protein PYV02_05685 [Leifsonia sp. H3M29-4]|uniref:hypothetical protein n=1 Tax=Salinibacterium metalliresistens TaxID=3031321 RepID=UPI0023DAC005|nr:hypothetical protein [Salinibacterium metalliresistens]MDF1478574.1 hypothetical protein [Salinibacterium metalliresistens]
MFSRSRTALVAASATLLMGGLSGCALLEPPADEVVLSDVARCTMGHTWTLDTADLATQLLAVLQRDHAVTAVDAAGTKTIDWGMDSVVSVTSDLAITVTTGTAEAPTTITQTQVGSAEGKVYINADVAIPRRWTDDVEVETKAESGGAELEQVPFGLPNIAFDDTVGLELTCDGTTLTVHPRGSTITQKWTTG